VIHCFKQQV